MKMLNPVILNKDLNENINTFIIDEYSNNITNITGTHLRDGEKPQSSDDCNAKGKIWWDNNNLSLSLRVFDNKCNKSLKFPVFNLYFGTSTYNKIHNCYILKLSFYPVIKENEKVLLININKYGKERSTDKVAYVHYYEINPMNYGYNTFIHIPWTFIGIEPNKTEQLLFDVAVDFFEEDGINIRTGLA